MKTCLKILLIVVGLCFPSLVGGEEEKEILISNVFIEADLRQALRDISSQIQVPIIPDPTVQGVVSLELEEVPLEKALKMLLFPLGYTFCQVEDYYLVGGTNPQSPSFNISSRTERYKLKHLKAEDLLQLIPASYAPYIRLSKDRNLITITAPDNIIERIRDNFDLLDKRRRQILLEVLISEVSLDVSKSLGMDWEGAGEEVSAELSSLTGKLTYQKAGDFAHKALLTIRALIEQGKAKTRANPKILAQDTETAEITIGTEKYISLTSGPVDREITRLQSVKAGVDMRFTPFVTEDKNIILQVESEVSEVIGGTLAGDKPPVIGRRKIKTTITARDGQTIAIGGLIQEHEEDNVSRIPFISRIPLLGAFFKKTTRTSYETELIIFITPRIIHYAEGGLRGGISEE
ncbi:MAG: hypothetical protein QME81_02720 [bacterium]|nr:hypothetical protein [bacterium]